MSDAALPQCDPFTVTVGNITLNQLPGEILQRIFDYLPRGDILWRIPLVCRLWYKLVQSHSYRKRLVLRRDVPPHYFLLTIRSRSLLRVLFCPALDYAAPSLPEGIRSCPYLKCLNIGFCNLTEKRLLQLASNLPEMLVHLNLEGICAVDLSVISVLVGRCPRLEALNLSHCRAVCDSCVDLIARQLPHLSRINLDGALWLSDTSLVHLAQGVSVQRGVLSAIWLDGFQLTSHGFSTFISELTRCPNIHVACSIDFLPKVLDVHNNTSLSSSVSYTGFLLTLWVSFCENLTDQSLFPITSLHNLSSLTLRKAEQISYHGWKELFSLKSPILNASGLTQLQHLDLSEAPTVDDSVINSICDCCGPHLRILLLNWCREITDIGLATIVETCSALRHLSLVGNQVIQGQALSRFSYKEPKTSISIINLTQCNQVLDAVIHQLVIDLPDVFVFDYFGERVGGGPDDVCHFDLWRALEKVHICDD